MRQGSLRLALLVLSIWYADRPRSAPGQKSMHRSALFALPLWRWPQADDGAARRAVQRRNAACL